VFPDNPTKVFDSVPFSEESSVQAYQYRHICYLAFWHCPHSMQNRTKRYRVRPSVSFIHPLQQQQHVVGLLLSALLVGDINRLLQLRGMRWWVKPVTLFTYPSVAA